MDSFEKKANENIKEYKIRLFSNRNLYELTNKEIAYYINKETNQNLDESTYRKWYVPYAEGFEDGKNAICNDSDKLKEIENKLIEFEKVKIQVNDQRTAYKSAIRIDSRTEVNKDLILKAINDLEPYTSINHEIIFSDNDLLVGLNDIHFGCEINNYWNKYNSTIAKNRLDTYLSNIKKIKKRHLSENCYVCANGDLISGNIHPSINFSNKENIVEQIMGVSELIAWFLSELGKCFNNVYLSVVGGNHSRISKKEDAPIYERLDDLIPWYIKARLSNINNIFVLDNDIDNTLNVVSIRKKQYLNVHGDYDGFKTIQKIVTMLPMEIYCVHFGHLHHNVTDWVQGYKLIMSGSLMGVDDYCVSKRILSNAQQLVCVCNKDGVETSYDVNLQ